MTKKEMQQKLDNLRRDSRAWKKGTKQFEERLKLEWLLEEHLYDKEKP